ncbi:signal recognition particle-docking protein FtsY [Oscillibacter sp.]|uniref:signal recognition particle-docking protein FtsY n=1 Tax=Oscillibacter sp. TaxID=1945593 RepID=UPI003396FD5D
MGFFSKLKKIWQEDITGYAISADDETFFDDLEEQLILADVGMETATEAVEKLRSKMKREGVSGETAVRAALRDILAEMLNVGDTALNLSAKPAVVLFIGVNGVGKTTSIGKLGHQMKEEGKKVLFCAADTFRAAAADQLQIWAERANCELVRSREGADPGAVLFDALAAAKARNMDVVLCDTAGRLHNKENLMKELSKLSKIIDRECPDASRETLLVLDATTGQNGLIQARTFKETAGLTGIVLTKLDGTAKGGIVIAIARELGVPVKYVGLGEGIDDLRPFDAKEYVEAII